MTAVMHTPRVWLAFELARELSCSPPEGIAPAAYRPQNGCERDTWANKNPCRR